MPKALTGAILSIPRSNRLRRRRLRDVGNGYYRVPNQTQPIRLNVASVRAALGPSVPAPSTRKVRDGADRRVGGVK
jgi:hypothetical protein